MRLSLLAAAVVASFISMPAQAGVFADDLARCFVTRASDQDRVLMMRWMFSAMSSDPRLSDMTTLNRTARDKVNGDMAALYDRLMLKDCREPAKLALKNEGIEAVEGAGKALGEAAAMGLFLSPQAVAELESFSKKIDESGFNRMLEEIGVNVPNKAVATR